MKIGVSNNVYKYDIYTNDSYQYLINVPICEYDIKNAGFNLAKYYKLLDDDTIKMLSDIPKRERTIMIGKMMRDNPEFNKELSESFELIRKKFVNKNNITDNDILSIKKDAIFVIDKKCVCIKFKNIEFVCKNKYTSFHRFGNIELYYNSSTNDLDVKGINNDVLYKHELMLIVLKNIFKMVEQKDTDKLTSYIKRFVVAYKTGDIDPGIYRQFNSASSFIIKSNPSSSCEYGLDSISGYDVNNIDKSYNYMNIILPIIQRYYYSEL